ncbi:MAG: TfuA-related McrA-glycine thioamidation protein [Methanocalculus sp. MSAO_Arc1]|uniref:TfuA-related McrA-glycine thioamidation protein n=1 Tax=Methanocalculus TaxID=71151 RepID=UPI000FEF9EE0|nr:MULTISPECIES: TfuA-related McrA-glycine thioamidation protein [unclassified Methanocalculus]MCP1662826.1 hypothetical protein [Methanocalculus sp. AMF5]RQD79009.1 MAG: TfuA-related McrA-glycine thioamidation protein [Methanocalculus sp. MSAO_Arc1]
MRGAIVYLGPSLPHSEAEAICPDAVFLPPIRRGDLQRIPKSGVSVICIIDGYFHQDAAVGHREILSILNSGVRVVGASSMGALRAAELDTLGMEGVGLIYSLYRQGRLISDDEVALIFDPETFAPLSDPLINIRCTLRNARRSKVITEEEERQCIGIASSLFYPERTFSRIIGEVSGDLGDRLASLQGESLIDQKQRDAIAALRYISDSAAVAAGEDES